YISLLNEQAQKEGWSLRYEEVGCDGLDHFRTFKIVTIINDRAFPEGVAVGKTKKEAKEEAAKLVYNEICGSEKSDMIKSLSVTTADTERNYISLINEHCQKKGFSHSFVMVDRQGPSHGPQFYYQLSIDGHKYPVGEGKTAKEARQNAAQLACLKVVSIYTSFNITYISLCFLSKNCESGIRCSVCSASGGHASEASTRFFRLAVHFPNAHGNSKENKSTLFRNRLTSMARFQRARKQRQGKKVLKSNQCFVFQRFTSEFDSISRLGSGGYGHVFKARNKLLGSEMAVKIVLCDEKALREAQALSDLDHCNIIRYYTCWLEDSGYDRRSPPYQDSSLKYLYIQMELCSTENLKLWIEKMNHNQNQERKKKSLSIFRQIVSGVEYIHSRNLIHRDLKPENIMFSKKEKEKVKIGDFGLVTVGAFEAKNLEERTVYKGTPWYMPPEQKDKKTYDQKVDIFPLGLIYFELL
uniref:Eukaryotic translation initiation factor 2-alpha kinase 2 n=1 Tax=Tetraodon nigroviridis TaxID=99883 RepID=H3C5V6_TETNG